MAKKVTIGQTTALIPEAGSAIKDEWIIDGESGNTNFPYADFKALATVGEVGPKSRLALTGYPDGNAAWLKDDDTVRVVYQSKSYGTLGSSYDPETWPHELESGVTFTGSKIHYIDYDRTAFADFMSSGIAASEMVKEVVFCMIKLIIFLAKRLHLKIPIRPISVQSGVTRQLLLERSLNSKIH